VGRASEEVSGGGDGQSVDAILNLVARKTGGWVRRVKSRCRKTKKLQSSEAALLFMKIPDRKRGLQAEGEKQG
jgi:hypothetical protein